MLTSVEADLVRRDSAVPGLATVLDPERFLAAVRRCAPGVDLRDARITYARCKPRSYCRVTYRLDVAGTTVDADARACRPEDLSRWLDGDGYVPGPLGAGRMVLRPSAVLVTVFPNDLKLPQLRPLADADQRRLALSELLPDRPELWEGDLRCLSYRRQRRYVAELCTDTGACAVVKAYTAKSYWHGLHNATVFRSHGALRLARLLGSSDSRRLLAFEWLPGRGLFDAATSPAEEWELAMRTGAALATLHDQDCEGLECWTREDETAALLSLAAEIGFLCPSLAGRADEFARRLGARLAVAPDLHFPVHGDFSAGQVLAAPPDVSVIDLDWACYADPADDLGNMLAQAEVRVLEGVRERSWVESLHDALLTGYAQATRRSLPERIALYTARGLFRRARNPFRLRSPEWPRRTEELLALAETVLHRNGNGAGSGSR